MPWLPSDLFLLNSFPSLWPCLYEDSTVHVWRWRTKSRYHPSLPVVLPRLPQGSDGNGGQWLGNPTKTTWFLFNAVRKCAWNLGAHFPLQLTRWWRLCLRWCMRNQSMWLSNRSVWCKLSSSRSRLFFLITWNQEGLGTCGVHHE